MDRAIMLILERQEEMIGDALRRRRGLLEECNMQAREIGAAVEAP